MKKLGVWLIVAVVLLVATANAQRGSAVRSAWEYKMVYVMGFGLVSGRTREATRRHAQPAWVPRGIVRR